MKRYQMIVVPVVIGLVLLVSVALLITDDPPKRTMEHLFNTVRFWALRIAYIGSTILCILVAIREWKPRLALGVFAAFCALMQMHLIVAYWYLQRAQ